MAGGKPTQRNRLAGSQWWRKLDYLLAETLVGLKRGGWLHGAAVGIMALLLFLVGVGLQTSWLLENVLEGMGDRLEISVYLADGTDVPQLQTRFLQVEGVERVEWIAKEVAWQRLQADLGEDASALGLNPLLDELRVRAQQPVGPVATRLAQFPGVEEVWYAKEALERLQELRRALTYLSVGVVAVCTAIALATLVTTVRLIVFARRQEIEILQLVGATPRWIYLPFVLQGSTFGLVGGVLAWGTLALLSGALQPILAVQPELVRSLTGGGLLDWRTRWLLPVVLLTFGALVGILGSLLAVGQFARRSPDTPIWD
ncbi:MAG: ABC transporter permease [Pseudanabaenaceae cyanobacterium]